MPGRFNTLEEFMGFLEKRRELVRIAEPVSPHLEMTEIADRAVKGRGPALLFENPAGFDVPVLMNAFASPGRMKAALGVEDYSEVSEEVLSFIEAGHPRGIVKKLRLLGQLKRFSNVFPKEVKKAPCQEVVHEEPDLDSLPVLHCWPKDGGRFITLPLVITRHPETRIRNVGMYRMQVFDKKTTGMHWHPHKGGAAHLRAAGERGERLEVAVAIGPCPATTYAATAPLPEDFDEMLFAGFLRKAPVEMVKCRTVDLEVPAQSQIVLEGYVEPGEKRLEGPFGDHTGYYSLADMYPVFHLTCLTRRKNPIYPATIVGRPPMEDCYMAKATERLFLPFIRKQLPEIVDLNLPFEGVFHNMAFVSIDKRYPGHGKKIMHSLWGLGQMMFFKIIAVFDREVDVQDTSEVLWRLGNNIDPERDMAFVEGPVDVLDHASPILGLGSKVGIDATRKWPEEGFTREWPPVIEMDREVKERIDGLWESLGIPLK